MTNEQAILILNPQTRREELERYADYESRLAAIEEACLTAVEVLRRHITVISGAKTCELMKELTKREGVETYTAEPDQDMTILVNGPAVVLTVID